MKGSRNPKKMKVTLEDVLDVTQKGFERIESTMATKADVKHLEERIDKVETKVDRIENILIRAQDNRLDKLEDDVRVLKTAQGIK